MKELFVKKYWIEDDILFYIHFQDGIAVRQIEIWNDKKFFLSTDCIIKEGSQLYDKHIDELHLEPEDFISKQEFDEVWRSSKK